MRQMNRKGFVLVETLIVSVFVMTLFIFFYTNVYPLAGEYTRRQQYDTVDSKYAAHWVRKMILEKGSSSIFTLDGAYKELTSCSSNDFVDSYYCINLVKNFSIQKIYLTKYMTADFKSSIASSSLSRSLKDYVAYLPTFEKDTNRLLDYRVVVEMKDDLSDQLYYGTIEVRL